MFQRTESCGRSPLRFRNQLVGRFVAHDGGPSCMVVAHEAGKRGVLTGAQNDGHLVEVD